MIDYMVDAMIRLDQTFRGRVAEILKKIALASSLPGQSLAPSEA